ncbi:hypothetical protein FHG87_020602 [Trinorchestia longiramus]|nr:hypothetical protein FHG87_020602 [Trinorchestia longiramus]
MPSSYEHRLPRVRVPFNALTFRIRIYTNDLWVRFTTSNGTVRTCSPSVYREQPALTHRLVPFIRRDFRALRAPLSLVDTLMNLLIQHRIESVCMVRALTPHLHHKTRHFLHELNCFAHSSYDFVGYDSAVRTRYSDFSLREVPPLSVDVDEDLDEQLRQPESVEIDLTDDSTPNPPPSSTSQANSSGHSTTTTTTTRNLRLTIPSNTELTLTARPVPSSSGGGNQYVVVPPPTRLLPHEGYNDGSLGSSISRVRNTSLSGTANRHRLHLSTEMRERLKRKVISVRRQRQHPVRTSSSYVSSDAQSELANSTSSLTGLLNSYNNDESPSTTLVVSSSDEGGTTATNNDASLSMSDHNYTSNPVRAPCTCGAQKSSSKAPSKSCVCILPKPPVAASSDSEECLIVEERKSSRPVQSTSSRNNDIESIVLSDSSSSSEDERAETKQNTSSETIRPSITSGAKLKIASDASPLKKTKPVRLDRKSFSISDFEMKSSLRRRLKSPCRALDVEAKDEHSEAVSSTVLKTSTTSPTNSGFDESPAKREPKDDPSRIKRSFSSKTKVSAGSATASSSPSSSRSETYESTTNKIIPSYKNGVSIRQSSPVTVRVETRNPRVNVSSLFELPSSCRDSRMAKKSRERSKHSTSMERSHAKVTGNKRNYNSSDDEVRTSPTKYRELCFSSETESTLQSSLQPRKKKKRDSSKHRNSKSTSSSFLNIARAARPIISDSESDSSRHRHHGSNDGRISSGFKTSRHLMRLESDSDSDLDSSDSCSSRKRSRSTKRRHVDRSVSGSDRRSQRSLLIKDSDQSDSDRQSRSAKTKSKKKKRDRKKSKSRDRLSRHKRKKSGKSSHRRRRDSDS